MKPCSFEEAVLQYDRLIKGQMKKLSLYCNHDEYYQCGLIALWRAYQQFEEGKGSFAAYALHTVRGYLLVQLQKEKRYESRHTGWNPLIAELYDGVSPSDEFACYLSILNEREQYMIEERIGSMRKLTDIARELGLTYDQARYLYSCAVLKLQKEYVM